MYRTVVDDQYRSNPIQKSCLAIPPRHPGRSSVAERATTSQGVKCES